MGNEIETRICANYRSKAKKLGLEFLQTFGFYLQVLNNYKQVKMFSMLLIVI